MKMILKGNEAAAVAAKLAKPDVVAAYPITPSTDFPEKMSEFVANGELPHTQFLPVESEHSAMSACVGAAAAGARVCTATASQGLELMHEILFIASGMRLPIVLYNANRALSAPINIWCDHQDTISARDTGWIQFYAENNQEIFDLMLIAFRVAEDKRVLLPAMACIDAFVCTHTFEPVDVPSQEEVDDFLPPYKPEHVKLDPEDPWTLGPFGVPEYYQEMRYAQHLAMKNAEKVIDEVFEEFERRFGRRYRKVMPYRTEDADVIFITIGSISGTAKEFVDRVREEGKKVGAIKITVLRPFPSKEILPLIKNAKIVATLERNISMGYGGAVYADLAGALINEEKKPKLIDFILGLGGRDVTFKDMGEILDICEKAMAGEKVERPVWIGVKKELIE
ncbi:MAG TPA: pyruvate ferredoxin oxidoreductase [Thermoplasmatales archaeon]|nr:pyruvate ferredoxin oxidoreductase [Thermoplasmatales archaeon]HEX17526.1 pyruvate ferredoxin oxidoreductase [Thermoplasmatales archaeon]